MTPEMYNFHQVITELQIAEDNMLDNHKQTNEQLHIMTEKAERLLRTADDVTYDQEGKFLIHLGLHNNIPLSSVMQFVYLPPSVTCASHPSLQLYSDSCFLYTLQMQFYLNNCINKLYSSLLQVVGRTFG